MQKLLRSIVLLALFAAAGRAGVLTDHLGRRIEVPDHPARIVSLAPSLTETLYALGAGDRVVGVTDYCDFPPEAKTKAKVGGMISPNMERIVALHPNLVLMTREGSRKETLDALERLNLPTFVVETQRLDDVARMIRDIGQAIGEAAQGASVATQLERRIGAVQSAVNARPARRALFLVWLQPVISVGRGTFLADLLERSGVQSASEASAQPWPHLSIEEIVRQDPEYIIVPKSQDFSPTRDELMRLPGWKDLTAVRGDKILYMPDAIQRAGPRIGEMMEILARAVHPGAFRPKDAGGNRSQVK